MMYDSGDYLQAFEKALEAVDYHAARAEQERARREGRYLGIGICSFVEPAGSGAWESGAVRVDGSGKATLLTGASSHGQGHQTAFAQIVADTLSIPMDDVEVIHGDTAAVPMGVGTFGSRSAALAGSAALQAAGKVRDKMRAIAANSLEARVEDVDLAGGHFQVAGTPSKRLSFAAVASTANAGVGLPAGMAPGLDVTEFFNSPRLQFPFGTHVAVVEVDAGTGEIDIRRYVAVDDCGTVINPLLVRGQIIGGLAQGFGQALLEELMYDEGGQLATGTLMDYALPKAATMPAVELHHTTTPSPLNPLGAKGVGEAGTTAAFGAIVNAVCDALAPLGIEHIDMPLTPPRVWAAIQASRGESNNAR
jgi:aerobic carbon-monoxide dehydrogenase large subunit